MRPKDWAQLSKMASCTGFPVSVVISSGTFNKPTIITNCWDNCCFSQLETRKIFLYSPTPPPQCCLAFANKCPEPYIAGGGGGGGGLPPPGKLNVFFSNIVFDYAGLFIAAILVRNLTCEGVQSLPPQYKKS